LEIDRPVKIEYNTQLVGLASVNFQRMHAKQVRRLAADVHALRAAPPDYKSGGSVDQIF
jgi:hypothetical protein